MGSSSEELSKLWAAVDAAVEQAGSYGFEPGLVAEGTRFATELMRIALELHCHGQDPLRPALVPIITPNLRWGWDNPYTTYHHVAIDGTGTYRFHGRRNTSVYLGFTVYGGGDERAGEMPQSVLGSINDTDVEVAPDGTWELTIAAAPRPDGHEGAWLQVDPDATCVWVRQYVTDPTDQVLASVHVERDPVAPMPTPLDDAELTRRFAAARRYFEVMWAMSDLVIQGTSGREPNAFSPPLRGGTPADGRPSGFMYPTSDNLYTFGRYRLADDETLLVTVTPLECRYWSFYLGTEFQQSLPYDLGYGLITRENAVLDDEGSVTFAIAATDPGVPNWLPTQGHSHGVMATRWLLPEVDEAPLPTCRLVPTASLSG